MKNVFEKQKLAKGSLIEKKVIKKTPSKVAFPTTLTEILVALKRFLMPLLACFWKIKIFISCFSTLHFSLENCSEEKWDKTPFLKWNISIPIVSVSCGPYRFNAPSTLNGQGQKPWDHINQVCAKTIFKEGYRKETTQLVEKLDEIFAVTNKAGCRSS